MAVWLQIKVRRHRLGLRPWLYACFVCDTHIRCCSSMRLVALYVLCLKLYGALNMNVRPIDAGWWVLRIMRRRTAPARSSSLLAKQAALVSMTPLKITPPVKSRCDQVASVLVAPAPLAKAAVSL